MKAKLLIILLFVSGIAFSVNNNQSQMDSAKNYYSKGQFGKAAKIYESVLKQGVEAPELYFNLGNAYYKSKQYTLAILNFERAKLLSPNDEDIDFNLQLSQRFVVDKFEEIPVVFYVKWYKNFVELYSSDSWAIFSIVSFISFLGLALLFLFTYNITIKKLSFAVGILMLLVAIFTFSFSSTQKIKLDNRDYAIVFSPSVTVKSSPDLKGTDIFVLHEGTKIKVIDNLGDWIEIKIANGNVGWLLRSDIVKI